MALSQSLSPEQGSNRPSSTSSSTSASQPSAPTTVEGGYKSLDDDYTYVRGRGRGRYVCNNCGIRCKKPSMLKKHIRTHSNFRPYTCRHCNFAFKTKGNLTKHMKSKAHHKKCVELGISPVPTTVEDAQHELGPHMNDQVKISKTLSLDFEQSNMLLVFMLFRCSLTRQIWTWTKSLRCPSNFVSTDSADLLNPSKDVTNFVCGLTIQNGKFSRFFLNVIFPKHQVNVNFEQKVYI